MTGQIPKPVNASPFRQRGMAAVLAVIFILFVAIYALTHSLTMSGSNATDTKQQRDSVEALMLAESAVERASRVYTTTPTCDTATLGFTVPNPLGGGANTEFSVISAVIDSGLCRLRVQGRVGNVRRTADVWLSGGGGTITFGAASSMALKTTTLTFAHNVPAGASILLVGISIDKGATAITGVAYGASQSLIRLGEVSFTGNVEASIWYLVSPVVGSANVVVNLSAEDEIVAGAVSLLGVSTTAPFNPTTMSSNTGNSTAATVSITPGVSGAWVFEVVAVDGNPNVNINSPLLTNQVQRWDLPTNKVSGGGSTIGPITPISIRNPRWTWTGNKKWAHAAAALQPTGSPAVARWTEVAAP